MQQESTPKLEVLSPNPGQLNPQYTVNQLSVHPSQPVRPTHKGSPTLTWPGVVLTWHPPVWGGTEPERVPMGPVGPDRSLGPTVNEETDGVADVANRFWLMLELAGYEVWGP